MSTGLTECTASTLQSPDGNALKERWGSHLCSFPLIKGIIGDISSIQNLLTFNKLQHSPFQGKNYPITYSEILGAAFTKHPYYTVLLLPRTPSCPWHSALTQSDRSRADWKEQQQSQPALPCCSKDTFTFSFSLSFFLFLPPSLPPPSFLPSFPSMQQWSFTAAAKSLQSCPTLCNPIDGSPPGSSVHGTLQARVLEWVAIEALLEI